MDLKKPLSMKEQVAILKSHGLIIHDELEAERILSRINYYRFTGYALQFRKSPSDSDYIPGISFGRIYDIYQFDEELRDLLRKYIEKIEVFYRTRIAYGFSISKCMALPHDQHYDENNFYNKAGYHAVMESFQKERDYFKDSLIVKHHKSKYKGYMPLWVIVELMSFSNLSKLYNSMYVSEKQSIASMIGISPSTMSNHLHCLSVLRNKCAHAARLYNTVLSPPAKFNPHFLRKYTDVRNDSLFAYIVILMKRLPEGRQKVELASELKIVLEHYETAIDLSCMGFPNDYETIFLNSV